MNPSSVSAGYASLWGGEHLSQRDATNMKKATYFFKNINETHIPTQISP